MTSLVILGIGVATAAVAGWRSMRQHGDMPMIDPKKEQSWLVRSLHEHPRLAAFVARRLDPAKASGLLLTVSITAIFVLAMIAGWVFDTLDEASGFAEFDEAVAQWGADNATDTSTFLLGVLTDLGGTAFITFITVAVAVYGWRRYKNFKVALFMVSVSLAQTIVNNGLKWVIDRERPEFAQLDGWAGSSFPSGHTAAAAATYAGIALVLGLSASTTVRAWLAAGAISIAVTVGATRALLGVHWLTDVIAGLMVGWAVFIAVAVAFGGRLMVPGEDVVREAEAVAASQHS